MDINDATCIYTLVYIIIVLCCFIQRNKDFVTAGVAIENIFQRILKKEHEDFIHFHIRRTSLTILVHSLLPLCYILGLSLVLDDWSIIISLKGIWWTTLIVFSYLLPLTAVSVIILWSQHDWEYHPIARKLQLCCNEGTSWKHLTTEINREYRAFDKLILEPSSLTKIIVTNSWIMKISSYNLDIVRQSESTLIVCNADTFQIAIEGDGAVQYINIEVKSTRTNIQSFFMRCTALGYNEIRNKIQRPIHILEGVTFHKSRMDQFLEVFRETIEQNPRYSLPTNQELETCIGCLLLQPEIKLVKHCNTPACTTCNCRPLWCFDCMAKWYASRQDQDRPETWLSSTCTCPLCRTVFCVRDVCLITKPD